MGVNHGQFSHFSPLSMPRLARSHTPNGCDFGPTRLIEALGQKAAAVFEEE